MQNVLSLTEQKADCITKEPVQVMTARNAWFEVAPPDWSRHRLPTSKKLLIVEDSALLQEVLASAFSELLGQLNTRIFSAYNGQMGLRMILEEQPEAIIFDLRMPLLDGLEMLEKLQNSDIWRRGYRPHLIALTGQIGLEYIEQAMNLGVHHYYTKPFNAQALLERIRSLLHN